MILSDFVLAVRDPLDDPRAQKYTNAEIVRQGDQQQRALFQTLIYNNKEHANFSYVLKSGDARQLFKNTYEWTLPTWAAAVVSVHERPQSSGIQEDTASPYLWATPESIIFQRKIEKLIPGSPTRSDGGWNWDGSRTLRLWNYVTKPELIVQIAKVPPRMFRAKIATQFGSGAGMYLPPAVELGTVDLEESAYVNAEVQCVSTLTAASMSYGVTRRCIYSKSTDMAADGTRQRVLKFDIAFPTELKTDDFVETLIPLPEVHIRYLVLLTAQACAQKKNIPLIKALQPELVEKRAMFTQYAAPPRDAVGPYMRSGGIRTLSNRDRDVRQAFYS